MRLYEAIASLRAMVGDTGLFLTSYGAGTTDVGAQVVPVQDLAMISVGHYVTIGVGDAAEGAIITEKSAATGQGTMTLSAPLELAHGAQSPINAVMVSDGDYVKHLRAAIRHLSAYRPLTKRAQLALVAGQDTYNLPADFISPDGESFDAAFGQDGEHRLFQSYYAILYDVSSQFAASGWGAGTTFGGVSPFGYAPVAGNMDDNPKKPVAGKALEFRFVRSSPPQLLVTPAPSAAKDLDFFYQATHTMPAAAADSTVPEDDVNLVLTYAQYLACLALSTGACQVMKYELEGEKIDKSKAPGEYRANADAALKKFEAETRFTPLGIKG